MSSLFLKDKYEYNFSCNEQVFSAIRDHARAYSGKIADLCSHTLNAQAIWNQRILGKSYSGGVWEVIPLEQLLNLNQELHQKSITILEEYELNQVISYANSKGDQFSNTVEDILFHVINHSTYHRGQLMSEMKQQGLTTFGTDFIFYKRS